MPNNKFLLSLGLTLALTSPLLQAGFEEAAAAFSAGDYDRALIEVRPLAEQGDPRGEYAMGVLYENGFAVEKNPPQAAAWYLKAALQGSTEAQFNLGAMHEHGVGIPINYNEAVRWYRPAAEAGDIDALNNLGVLCEKGRGVAQNKVLAMALYNLSVAAAQDSRTKAAVNRQKLANRMPLEDVQESLTLTDLLLEPGNLKPVLERLLGQQE
jgi:TPR repeat protein